MEQAEVKHEIIPGGMTTNCMLVKVKVTGWDARRKSKRLTKDTAERHGIQQGDGKKERVRVYKTLIDPERVDAMQKLENAIRAYVYSRTMPWLDEGTRLITAAAFQDFNKIVHAMIEGYKQAAKELVLDYPQLKAQARIDLNGEYDESEYPSLDALEAKYTATVSYSPVPTAGDVRVAIQSDALARIKAEVEEREKAATAVAMKDVWGRIHKNVGAMAERLSDPKNKFHDTLVGNLLELCNLLPLLNWTGDFAMEQARRDIEARLCAYEPQQLRDDAEARKETHKAAAELAAQAKAQLDQLESVTSLIF